MKVMEKHNENSTKEIEKLMSKTFNQEQKVEKDVLSLILTKISELEKKIDRIEYQTKMHWVN